VRRALFLALAGLVAMAAPAAAQSPALSTTVQQGPTLLDATRPAWGAPPTEHLFGDWWGLRPQLEQRGIYLSLDAIAEFAGNVSGGIKQGATSANQIAFSADIDWQKLAGVTGLSTHVIFVNRSGANDSQLFGDNVTPVQEIYGAGGDVAIHLVSAYAEESLLRGQVDVAAGWMNVENDFASSPLYCYYMNNDLCGDPKALPGGDIGHSAYPDAVWGGRIRVRPTPDTYVVTGVYGVNRDLYGQADSSGFDFAMPHAGGVYVPIQAAYEPKIGPDHLPGHYVVGFGYDTSRFQSFSNALPASAGIPTSSHNGNTQFWILADQMLMRNGPGDEDGLIALAGFIRNDPDNSSYAQQYFVGMLDYGFWRARPDDGVGLLFNYIAMSGTLGKVQAEQQALGLPVSNAASGIQTNEMVIELDYNIHVYRGLDFRPDFQYVIRPNAQSTLHDAAVFGFKAHVVF
jgi:porin